MAQEIDTVRNALAYARFENEDIKKALDAHLKELDADLVECNYEAGSRVDRSTEALQKAIDNADASRDTHESRVRDELAFGIDEEE